MPDESVTDAPPSDDPQGDTMTQTAPAPTDRGSARSASRWPTTRRRSPHGTPSAAEPVIQLQERALLLRLVPRGEGRLDRRPAAGDHRAHRAVGLRQVHAAAVDQPDERPDPGHPRRGPGPVPRRQPVRPGRRPGRGPAADRHGLPEAEPVPEVDLRQRRLRAADRRLQGQHGRARRVQPAPGRASGTRSRTSSSSPAWRCPAASSSACASPARSPPSPT